MQAALVLGASGSVGHALVKELIRNGSFKTIVTFVRRSMIATSLNPPPQSAVYHYSEMMTLNR